MIWNYLFLFSLTLITSVFFGTNTQASFRSEGLTRALEKLGPIDVAADLEAGRVYTLELRGNPSGRVVVLDSQTEEVLQEIYLGSIAKKSAFYEESLYEIEKSNSTLFYLEKGDHPSVSALDLETSKRSRVIKESSLRGYQHIRNLKAEVNGSLTLEARELSTDDEVLLVFNPSKEGTYSHVSTLLLKDLENYVSEQTAKTPANPQQSNKGWAWTFTAGQLNGVSVVGVRHYVSEKFGYQISGLGWGRPDDYALNAGALMFYRLSQYNRFRLQFIAGSSAFFSHNAYTYQPCYPKDPGGVECDDPVREVNETTSYNFGIGLGIEYRSGKRGPAFSLEFPVGISFKKETGSWVNNPNFGVDRFGFLIPGATLMWFF